MKRRRPIDVPPKVPTYAILPLDAAAVTDALQAHLFRSLSTTPGALEALADVVEATAQADIYTVLVRHAFPRLSATAQHALVAGLVATHSPVLSGGLRQVTPETFDPVLAALEAEIHRRRAGERQTS